MMLKHIKMLLAAALLAALPLVSAAGAADSPGQAGDVHRYSHWAWGYASFVSRRQASVVMPFSSCQVTKSCSVARFRSRRACLVSVISGRTVI